MKINPVLKRELLSFQRGWKMPIILWVYNGLMILMLSGLYFTMSHNAGGGVDPGFMKGLYYFLTIGQMVMLILMVPAVTAASISGERQRGTLDILLVSSASPWTIILGKIQAGLYSFMILQISSLPLYAIIGMYGGISVLDVVFNFLLFMVLALFYGAVGLCSSAWLKKHQTSMVISYVVVFLNILLSLALTTIGMGLFATLTDKEPGQWISALLYLNPFVVLLTHLDVQMASEQNILAMFNDYTPLISLSVMIVLHLGLSVLMLYGAKVGLKRNQ